MPEDRWQKNQRDNDMDKNMLTKILAFIHLRFRAHGTELGVSAEEVIQEARKSRKAKEPSVQEGGPAEPEQAPQCESRDENPDGLSP